MPETFGERLRRLRIEAGLSQPALAGDGLSPSYISLLETGKRTPSDEVINQLARRLGVSAARLRDDRQSDSEALIDLELRYARLALDAGEAEEARNRLRMLVERADLPQRAFDEAQWWLGIAHGRLDEVEDAVTVFRQLYDRARDGAPAKPLPLLGIALVGNLLECGDVEAATRIGEEALELSRRQHLGETDDYFRLAAVVMDGHMRLGNYTWARAWAERYIAEAEAAQNKAGQAALYWNAAHLAEARNEVRQALVLCERALGLMGELDTARDTPRLQIQMVVLLLCDMPPQVERARTLLEQSKDTIADLGSAVDKAYWRWLRSQVSLFEGDPHAAEAFAEEALQLVRGGTAIEKTRALLAYAMALRAQRRDQAVDDLLTTAMHQLSEAPTTRNSSGLWRELGDLFNDVGRLTDAFIAWGKALDSVGVRSRTDALFAAIEELRERTRPAEHGDANATGGTESPGTSTPSPGE